MELCDLHDHRRRRASLGSTSGSDSSSVSAPEVVPFALQHLTTNAVEEATERIDTEKLYKIPCVPVDCKFGLVQEKPELTLPLKRMIQKERKVTGGKVTVLFAIRRPGCGSCREHGLQLTELDKLERDVSVVGTIKHIGVDDQALLDFYQQYFRFPISIDKKWEIFKAMGGRKIRLWQALFSTPRLTRRYKSKGIPNVPFGGDIWTQGGVLVFDREGNLRYTHYEIYGELLDLDELRKAISDARKPLSPAQVSTL